MNPFYPQEVRGEKQRFFRRSFLIGFVDLLRWQGRFGKVSVNCIFEVSQTFTKL